MARLKKATAKPKGGMELAFEREKEACEALGEPFNEKNFQEEVEETPEDKLSKLVPSYQVNKAETDKFKKKADVENKEIKEIMLSSGIEEFVAGTARVTCTTSTKESFIEESLIATIKKLKIKGIVKRREYVDMDALENAIYNKDIDPIALTNCQEKAKVVTLRLSKVKK